MTNYVVIMALPQRRRLEFESCSSSIKSLGKRCNRHSKIHDLHKSIDAWLELILTDSLALIHFVAYIDLGYLAGNDVK